jgi:hypothetical protein
LAHIEDGMSVTQASFDRIEHNLNRARDVPADCHNAYLKAPGQLRRLFNQALFVNLYLDEEGVGAVMAEPFATLCSADLAAVIGPVGVG